MKQIKIYRRAVNYKKAHGLRTISEWDFAVAYAGFIYKQPNENPEKEPYYKNGWIHIGTLRTMKDIVDFTKIVIGHRQISPESSAWLLSMFEEIKMQERRNKNAVKKTDPKK